jgi:hypothetical protein
VSRDRDSLEDVDGGHRFDTDSITIPDELRDTSNFGQQSATRPVSTLAQEAQSWRLWLALILGAAVLGMGGAVLLRDDPQSSSSAVAIDPGETAGLARAVNPSPAPKKELTPSPQTAPSVAPTEPSSVENRNKKSAAVTATKPKIAKSTEPVTPKTAPANRLTEKPVRKKRRARRPKRSLDDALAKLQDFEEEADLNPKPEGMQASGNTIPAAASLSPDLACAKGDLSACVLAGQAAEKNDDGAKARQFYGIACAKAKAAACGRLARLLEKGVGGTADLKRAHSLRKKACTLGHSKSCASVKTTTSTVN